MLLAPVASAQVGIAYTSFANIFTANQRINAGVGINVAPGATGTLSLSGKLFEQSRSTGMGDAASVSYSAGNFSVPAGTWTVDSGDQQSYSYTLIGANMILNVRLLRTTTASSPTELRVAVPGGCSAPTAVSTPTVVIEQDSTGTAHAGLLAISGLTGVVRIFNDISASTAFSNLTNDLDIFLQFTFPVSGC